MDFTLEPTTAGAALAAAAVSSRAALDSPVRAADVQRGCGRF